MMIDNMIVFYITAFFLVLFAVISVVLKDVMHSLLSAIVVFFSSAVIFYLLGSEYNAIIQAAIYGLAVPVIIGLSVMFTDKKEKKTEQNRFRNFAVPYITILGSAIFILAFVYLVIISLVIMPESFNIMPTNQVNAFDIISAFAKGVFINYVWAFELVSLLLTIVIAGIVMISNKRDIN